MLGGSMVQVAEQQRLAGVSSEGRVLADVHDTSDQNHVFEHCDEYWKIPVRPGRLQFHLSICDWPSLY
jgi:hypothetical protein